MASTTTLLYEGSWDEDATSRLIEAHTPRKTWRHNPPTYHYFLCHTKFSKKKKAAGPNGVPPHLVQRLLEEHLRVLFEAITAIWHGAPVPKEWLVSRTVLLYKKEDPADSENYRPLAVSNAIYILYMKWVLARIRAHTTAHLTKEQHGVKGRTTTQCTSTLRERLHAKGGFVVLLDVAKAFPSVPRPWHSGGACGSPPPPAISHPLQPPPPPRETVTFMFF